MDWPAWRGGRWGVVRGQIAWRTVGGGRGGGRSPWERFLTVFSSVMLLAFSTDIHMDSRWWSHIRLTPTFNGHQWKDVEGRKNDHEKVLWDCMTSSQAVLVDCRCNGGGRHLNLWRRTLKGAACNIRPGSSYISDGSTLLLTHPPLKLACELRWPGA